MKEDMDKIGTEQAKAEFEARREMAREEEAKILAEGIEKHHKMVSEEPNWALYNYILSIVSFKDCKIPRDFGHQLFRHLWPYVKRYHNDRVKLIQRLEDMGVKIDMPPSPIEMAEEALNMVTKAARDRARAKKYGLHVAKNQIITDGQV